VVGRRDASGGLRLEQPVSPENGSPVWLLVLFGLLAAPLGLYLWHRQGPHFGLGGAKGNVSPRAALASAALFLVLTGAELLRSGMSDESRSQAQQKAAAKLKQDWKLQAVRAMQDAEYRKYPLKISICRPCRRHGHRQRKTERICLFAG